MAFKRMFSLQIVDSDAFLDMPTSSRELYFQLGMRADDDGFIGNPKKIIRMLGATDDDLKLLIVKRFILTFESGILVIKHWKINNYVRSDRYKETHYLEEKILLITKDNGSYTEKDKISLVLPVGIPNVNQRSTQYSIEEKSIVKNRLDEQARPLSSNGIKKEPSESQQLYRRIVNHLQVTLDMKITNWGKQFSAVKSMLDAGYTELQITKTIDYMAHKDEFYSDKGFDMTTVSKQIPLYKAQMRKAATI